MMLDVERHVRRLLMKYEVFNPPVPVEDIAAGEGAVLVRQHFEGTESGFILRTGEQVVIGVNTRTGRRRQRFSIAHELGHLLLHGERDLLVDHAVRIDWRDEVSSLGTDKQEIEANAFGASLLMPKDYVINAVRSHVNDVGDINLSRDQLIIELAREFDVSVEAMGFRLINLGIFAA